jgi:DNA-binding CsgD family transcriptional regulator
VVGASGLTSREREVAQLAAERLTAQEIAERLFISRRTVETHLARVYAKLGVASKSELARRLAEVSPTATD